MIRFGEWNRKRTGMFVMVLESFVQNYLFCNLKYMQLPVYLTVYSLEVDFIFILHFVFAKNKIKENELFSPINIRE